MKEFFFFVLFLFFLVQESIKGEHHRAREVRTVPIIVKVVEDKGSGSWSPGVSAMPS